MAYKCTTAKRKSTDFIVIHCSATQAKADIGAAEIDRWHRKQGWQCIGYTYVIRRCGTIEEGREEDKIGSHVQNHNANSLGICMIGGVAADGKTPENNFTTAQFDSLKALVTLLKIKYPHAVVQGHRDFPNVAKACPSFSVKDWLNSNTETHPIYPTCGKPN